MKKGIIAAMASLAMIGAASADTINVAWHQGPVTVGHFDTLPDGTVVSTGSNGTDTWNNLRADVETRTFTGRALDLADGTSSGALLAGATEYSAWNTNGSNDDYAMMASWYGIKDAEHLTITGLSPAFTTNGYKVIIYGDSDEAARTMVYEVAGTTKTIIDSGSFSGTFTEGVNMATFTGLTTDSFTITQGAGGQGRSTINGFQIVAVNPNSPPSITTFDASRMNVFAGETVTLSWVTSDADTLSLDQGIGDVTGTTSTQVVVHADTTYTLTATNTNGTETASVSISLITAPPVIQSFTASRMNVLASETTTLSWQVDGAISLSIDQGIGDVTGTNQVDVIVTTNSTYTLIATNAQGSTNAMTTVSVVELNESNVISINFDDGTRSINGPFGAVVAANWNLADIGSTDSPVTTLNLLLSSGETSTADLDLSNRNPSKPVGGWAGDGVVPGATGDMAQLFHYRNRNGGAIATIRDLPFATCDVYVYFNIAVTNTATYDLSLGGITQPVTTLNTASSFVEANAGNSYTGNYYVFKDVEGSTFTLTAGDDSSDTITEYIFGMQIVDTGYVMDGPVTLTIAPMSAGTEMEISWFGKQDSFYGVETNANLIIESGWKPLGSDVVGADGTITITNTIGPNQTFYRVISK